MTWASRPAPIPLLGDLRVGALRLTIPAGVGGADQFADEDRQRLVARRSLVVWPMRILCVPQHAHTFSASLRSISSRRRGRSFGLHRRPWPFRFGAAGGSEVGGSAGVGTSASGTTIPSKRVGPSTRSPPRPNVIFTRR